MQKLFILILTSLVISCGSEMSQEKKDLKSYDLDGDKILELRSDDLVANMPQIDFSIDYISSKDFSLQVHSNKASQRFKNQIKEIGNQKIGSKIKTSPITLFSEFSFFITKQKAQEELHFVISQNESLKSISKLILKITLPDVPGVSDFIHITDEQLWNRGEITLKLTHLLPFIADQSQIKIMIEDFYFKRNNIVYNFTKFHSDLRLKNYLFSLVSKNKIKTYMISKKVNIEEALEILKLDVRKDELGMIKSIRNEENYFPLSHYASLRESDGFWVLTNTTGQSLNFRPSAGENISLIYFTKNDFIEHGLKQKEEVIGFNRVRNRILKYNENIESIQIKNIMGDVLIPQQIWGNRTRSYEHETRRGTCGGKCKGITGKSHCTVRAYSIEYKRISAQSHQFNEHFNSIFGKTYLFSMAKDYNLELAPQGNYQLLAGEKNIDCPSKVKTSLKSNNYSILIDGKVTLVKRFKP